MNNDNENNDQTGTDLDKVIPGSLHAPDANDSEGPGETQEALAARQAKVPASVSAIADVMKKARDCPALVARRVEPAEGVVNHWYAKVDPGTTCGDLENSSFWQHYTKELRPNDEVDAKCVDGSFLAKMIVVAVGPADVKMHVWAFIELDAIDPEALAVPSGYDVKWAGDLDKFRVTRGSTVVRTGFEHRSQAMKWLGGHLQGIAR